MSRYWPSTTTRLNRRMSKLWCLAYIVQHFLNGRRICSLTLGDNSDSQSRADIKSAASACLLPIYPLTGPTIGVQNYPLCVVEL
jgi:hypothetical protein